MPRVYPLGGRWFAVTETLTSRQDGYLIVQTQDIGLSAILAKRLTVAGVDADAADADVARELIVAAHRADKFHRIIAGRLVEDGKKWNPKDAEANADYFADLSAPEDKAHLAQAFTEVLAGFFLSVAGSLAAFPTLSAATTATENGAKPSAAAASSTPSLDDMAGPSVPDSSPTAIATN